MKNATLMSTLIMLITSIISHYASAADVVNEKNGRRITAECIEKNESSCIRYQFFLNAEDSKIPLSVFTLKPLDGEATFLLREKIKKFKYFPVTKFAYANEHFNYTAVAGYGGLLGVPLVLGAAPIIQFGVALSAGGAMFIGILALPTAADLVSMPARAVIRKMKIKKANRDEAFAVSMLSALIDENSNEVVSLKNKKFKILLNAFTSGPENLAGFRGR